MLKIDNFSYSYIKNKEVIHDLNIKIENGEILGFIGPNGAGKTTTIKSMVGINHIDVGDITLNNISVKNNPLKYKKLIAYVPDEPLLYENLTGIQYLNFISDMFLISEKKRQERITKYAKLFDMYQYLGNLISSYSHGMKQKLVLISAFIHDPKLYVLDEPFASLDPESSFKLKKILKEEAEKGKIIFFSTHVLEVAEKTSTSVALIKDGKIVINEKLNKVLKNKSLEDLFMETVKDE